ncbi:MAG TPA: hypothetical protein VNB06_11410 [Thermoanaerobaculia bacterium]|nr:hypothetical protein [Thermoanaerobaculia bacterium]
MSNEDTSVSSQVTPAGTEPEPGVPDGGPLAPGSQPPWHYLRPVWELELLISGAVVFSLFRLPELLSRSYLALELHLSSRLFLLPFMMFYVVTLLVIALMIAFSVHFFLRGFWVALCGLNIVFPDGILWDRFDVGPIQRRVYLELMPDPRSLERRVDRLASTVFSVLFLVLLSLFFGMLWLIGISILAAAVGRLMAPDKGLLGIFYVVCVLLMAPLITASMIDRWFKKDVARVGRHPRLARFAEGTFRGIQAATLGRFYNSILLVFSTHFSTTRASFVAMFASLALVALFLAYFVVRLGLFGFDSYIYYPTRPSPMLMRADHYENLRGEGADRVATIQSDVIDDPYLRLFIPYLPNRDRDRMAEHCPDVEPLRGEGLFLARRRRGEPEQVAAVAACLRDIYRIRLNDVPIELPVLAFHRRPSDGAVGVLVHLPTASMPAGRNVLEVGRKQLASDTEGESPDEDELRREYLPFWR